jgi:pimeloyl-ACP methyl ester carboxylesterase
MKLSPYLLLPVIAVAVLFSCNHSAPVISSKINVQDNKVNIAYTDTGKGDTTLLFVHGWAINKGYWSNQSAYFAGKYRVVAIDMPGFGESGKNRADWSTDTYARDVDSTITRLNLKNVVLIGHSMAGDIVLQAAIDNPKAVIGIVGVDNFKGVGHVESPADKKSFSDAMDMMKKNFKGVASQYFSQYLFSKTTDTAIKKRILNDVAHADSTIAIAAMEQGNDFDEVAKLHAADLKLYLINSDYQPTDTSGLVKNKLPYKLFIVHGTGHFPMVEDPKDFNKQLENVIEDIKRK